MAENPEDLIVTDAELRRQLPALADELGIGGMEATELGTEHLDTVTTPGTYTQSANLEATLESGYPMTRGGVLQVERSVSRTMVWQTYTTYATSATNPPQTWQRGSYNGVWSAWAKIGGAMPDGGQPGQVLTTGADGKAKWGAVSQTLEWSKDAQAKAQGYWIVVSGEEPASATYTTADGTVVPVIWQQPITRAVPILPQTPAFSRASSSLSVPDLVGVVYRLTGWSKDNGGTWTTVSTDLVGGAVTDVKAATGQELPVTVRVEALAKPGYVLPNPYKWTFDYPDPNATVVLTSDTFAVDRTNAGGTPTTAALGGTAYTYTTDRTGVVLAGVAESGAFALKFGETKNFEVSFDLVGRRDTATNLSMSLRVATSRTDTSDSGAGVSLTGNDTANLSRRQDGNAPGDLQYGGWTGVTSAYGTWVLTVIGDTLTIQPPNGGTRETWTLTRAALANYGTTRGSNVAFSLTNARIDNLIVKQAGY